MRHPRLLRVLVAIVVFAAAWTPLATAHGQQPAAQQLEDVVYLKDGSIIRGIIIEMRPSESVLIRTRDGNQFRYQMNQIEKMTKEVPVFATVPVPAAVPAPAAVPVARANPKSPGTAAVLSFLIPGAGQAYNGEWGSAAIFFVATGWSFSEFAKASAADKCYVDQECGSAMLWFGLAALTYTVGIMDAVSTANSINREAQGSASLSILPWVEVARVPRVPGESSASRGVSRPNESRLHVGVLRLRW